MTDKTIKASDFGTPEFQKKKQVVIGHADQHTKRARVKHASVLDYYVNAGHIDEKQYTAGYKLGTLWRVSGKDAKVTMTYNDSPRATGSVEDATLLRTQAQQQYKQAMAAVRFPAKRVVEDVCCHEEPARKHRMRLLREGLNDLVERFKI